MASYLLITPARNEEAVIESTIQSLIAQTHRPVRWIIVDDGSTDRTASIGEFYAAKHDFIRLVATGKSLARKRHFGRKVQAFNKGLESAAGLSYEYVGNLDADMLLPPDYYERILTYFRQNPRLGIAGGVLYTQCGKRYVCDDTSTDSVGGAVQLFRKECFQEIGGYCPLPNGGIDTAAEVTARMNGWVVRKFSALKAYEQRPTGSVGQGSLVARFREGIRCHALGYGTGFYAARCLYKCISNRPFLLGSAAALSGFLFAKLRHCPVMLPTETVEYLRAEQSDKLRRILTRGDRSFLIR